MSAINIKTNDGKTYTLAYTRDTFIKVVTKLKRMGINYQEDLYDPMIAVMVFPELFEGAFLANHADVDSETIKGILENLTEKEKIVNPLMDLFLEPFTSLTDSLEEKKEGNVSWEVTE